MLAYCGLRWGEAAALRPRDFDLAKRRIHLTENAVSVGSETYVGTLKTGDSRTVPMPTFVAAALKPVIESRPADALMWPAHDGTHLRSPSTHDSWLSGAVGRCIATTDQQRAKEAAETGKEPTTPAFPRITAHDLRHTAASLAISSGANVKAIQRMLGHASAAMTLDVYADLFDDDLDTLADALDEARAKAVPKLCPLEESAVG